jgi:hypothetical protein
MMDSGAAPGQALVVTELRVVEGGHVCALSRPVTTPELAIAMEVFPRREEALCEVVDGLSWDFSGFETSRVFFVAGLTTGARPRVERALYEILSEVNPGAEQEIRASLDASRSTCPNRR